MKLRLLLLFCCTALSGCNLSVSTSLGGRIVSEPLEIDCRHDSGNCSTLHYEDLWKDSDEEKNLLAQADDGFRFSHWEGDCKRTDHNTCFLRLSGEVEINAVFKPITYATSTAPQKTVRFVSMGDFGEGNLAQGLVSEAIESVCEATGGCDFIIGLGDNIYDDNPTDVYHDAFEVKFELPYLNLDIPFYMSLGNHDNDLVIDGLGSYNHAGDIQVAYTERTDKLSDKWQMPDRYYSFSAPLNDALPLVDFFALDSNPMIAPLEVASDYAVGPYKAEQAQWFSNALSASVGSWKIAYTHHPYVSNGQHGDAGNYDGIPALEPLTKRLSGKIYRDWFEETICGKVDVFLAGHDHDMQFLQSVPECGKTLFIISGAGAKSREFKDETRNAVYWQKDNATGFYLLELQANTLTVNAYVVDGYSGETQLAFSKTMLRRANW